LPENYVGKINKMPEFCVILAQKKMYQNARLFMIFATKLTKCPNFTLVTAPPKYFGGGGVAAARERGPCPLPVSFWGGIKVFGDV